MIGDITFHLFHSQELIRHGLEILGVVSVLSGVAIGLHEFKANSKKNDFEFIKKLEHSFKFEITTVKG